MSYQSAGGQTSASGQPPRPGLRTRPPATQADAAGPAISIGDVLGMLRRHLAMIVILTLVLGGTGTALTLYVWQAHPTYVAEARINIEAGTRGRQPGGIPMVRDQIEVNQLKSFINTQVRGILDPKVLQEALTESTARRVINELNPAAGECTLGTEAAILTRAEYIRQNAPSMLGEGGPAVMAARLGRKINVENVFETTLVSIKLKGRDRRLITDVVNSVVDAYMLDYKSTRTKRDERRVAGLRRQLSDVEARLAAAQNELQVFKTERGGVRLIGERTDITERLRLLQAARTQAQLEMIAMQLLQKQLEAMREDATVSPEMTLRIENDPTLLRLKATEADLLSVRQQRLTRFDDSHDEVRNLDSRLATTRAQIEARKAELTQTLIAQQQQEAETTAATARNRFNEISAEYDKAYSLALQQEKDRLRYEQYQAEYQVLSDERDTIRKAITTAQITDDVSANNVVVYRPAAVPAPQDKAGPKPQLYVPLSVFGALLLSLALALLVEQIDNRIRTPLQAIRVVRLPVLGTVPDRREDLPTREVENLAQVTVAAPQSLMAESFRQLRTALMYSTDTDLKSLLVTSPKGSDGKTVVASNLAITLAQGGSRVLLVDANFRRPMVHRVFDLPNTVGLSSVLARLNTLDEAVQATSVANLDALCSGPQPPSPADLLGSEAMQTLLTDAAGRYDNVVIDGAPILVVADAHVLCSMVDGTAMVISCADTSRGVATRGKRTLQMLKAQLVGAVLNRVRATRGGYFREAYRSYYDYAGGTTTGQRT